MDGESFSFGCFRLDLGRRELSREDKPMRLHRRALDILCALAAAKGEVVAKDELMAQLWPGRIVGEGNLHVHVSALRKALDEHGGGHSGEGHSYVVTVPGRGYRLAGLAHASSAGDAASNPPQLLPLPDKPSIAVLPFLNLSGDPEQEYFVDGVVEEIITSLCQIHWLFVIARNSTFAYKGRAIDVKQIGRELGVRYVLEGSVRRATNQVRIIAQLIDTRTGVHIWSGRFGGPLDDIFELQDQVASGVVGVIEPRLRLSEIERANRKPPQSLDAHDLYLQALGRFHKHTEEGAREAIDLLKQALGIDPVYASAAALICECYVTLRGRWGTISDAEIEEGVHLARQAIQWSRNDPDVLWMSGICLSAFAGEHNNAAGIIERALSVNPNSAQAWSARGWVAYAQNQLGSAIDAFESANRLSPLDPLSGYITGGLAVAHLDAGRYEEALEWADRSLRDFPDYLPAMRSKIVGCVQLGRIDEARNWVNRLLERRPTLTITGWRAGGMRHLPPEIASFQSESLRAAGMPEA